MHVVEIYIKDEMVWAGVMPEVPQPGNFVSVAQQPTFEGEKPDPKLYQISTKLYPVTDGYPIMQLPPRLQAIEIDHRTGRPKEPLVKPMSDHGRTPDLIH